MLLLGRFALRLWVITGLAGVWVALRLAEREARRLGLDPAAARETLDALLVGAIAGAVLANPLAGALPWLGPLASAGPLSPRGALLGLAAAALVRLRSRPVPFWPFLDAAAPAVALGLAVAFLGTSFLGRPTALPWGVSRGGDGPFHPLSLYLALASLGGWALARAVAGRTAAAGQVFLLLALYGALVRLLLEWAVPSAPWLGPLTAPQAASLLAGVAAWAAYRWRERPEPRR